jgi:hypothetical protein
MSSSRFHSRRTRVHRATALVAAATLTLNACTYWVAQQRPIGEIVTEGHPKLVRITTSENQVRDLTRTRIVGDSIFGIPLGLDGPEYGFALSDIHKVDLSEIAPGHTVVFVVLGGLLFVTVAGWEIARGGR